MLRHLSEICRCRHIFAVFDFFVFNSQASDFIGQCAVGQRAVAQNREAMIYEASDLVYHLLVLLEATGCSIADLEKELARRHS